MNDKSTITLFADTIEYFEKGGWSDDALIAPAWHGLRVRHLKEALSALTHPQPRRPGREDVARVIEQMLWSPASGPVEWTDEKIASAKSQAQTATTAILALLPASPVGWRPIESAPKGVDLLLWLSATEEEWPACHVIGRADSEFGPGGWNRPYRKPTHWQSLPASPVPSTGGEGG